MENLTPMLKQYNFIKKDYADCILFFRLGDFYEMFYDDAKVASQILDLVLTSKSAGKIGKVPMCGIPFHAADSYISRLIKGGYKVAICEQVEDPSKAKGIVKREVIRVITSGTFIDENTHEERYIVAIYPEKKEIGISFLSSEGETIFTNQFRDISKIVDIIFKYPVYEVIFPEEKEEAINRIFKDYPYLKLRKIVLSGCQDYLFNYEISKETIFSHFKVESLNGFGIEKKELSVRTSGAIIEYLRYVNKKDVSHISKISIYSEDEFLYISPSAVYGLEIDRLVRILNRAITPSGKRILKQWIYHPLKDVNKIKERYKAVRFFINEKEIREKLRDIFKGIGDVEKSVSKISCGYGTVKDIFTIANFIFKLPEIKKVLSKVENSSKYFSIEDIEVLRNFFEEAIDFSVSPANYEGNLIKKGYNEQLDELREIRDNAREYLRNLQKKEIEKTGINSLKIGFNKVFGYYIEITKPNLHLVPQHYIRKQTLVNAERFITPELKEFEEKILTAESKIKEIEDRIIEDIKNKIIENSDILYLSSRKIGEIDVLSTFALVSEESKYVMPEIDDGFEIFIKEGRHPVVEKTVDDFIPNDTYVNCSTDNFLIITGPNMSGKSTYIRQVGLIVIMAQSGCFVPATYAKIGIVDKIFTRIGSQDEISKGQSTFMVEMTETAEILNNLTKRSLVILDEIGRGTSTYDGFSLAWAVSEYLQSKKVKTLFATHFHELTALSQKYKGVKNYNVAVKKEGEDVIFLHKIMEGSTDESYGIYVAKLAGIPEKIIKRAEIILNTLELEGKIQDKIIEKESISYPSLFENIKESEKEENKNIEEIRKEIEKIEIEKITPIEALLKLKELKEKLENGKD